MRNGINLHATVPALIDMGLNSINMTIIITFELFTVYNEQPRHNPEDSSDDEIESESPLDEYQKPLFAKSYLSGPPTSLSIRERRQRRDSVSRSDTSGSSAGDLGDITPCNASPHMPGLIYRAPIRDEAEEAWRQNLQSMLVNQPTSHPADLLLQLYRVIKVSIPTHVILMMDSVATRYGFITGINNQIDNTIERLDEIFYWRWHTIGQSHLDAGRIVVNQRGATTYLV